MYIIPLSRWTGKLRRCPRKINKKGTYEPTAKSDKYVVLYPNETMISVYDEKSYKQALVYAEMYREIRKKALKRKESGEAFVYQMKKPSEDKLGRETFFVHITTDVKESYL